METVDYSHAQDTVDMEQSTESGTVVTRSFACKHAGCGKRFTRLEHLNRHALNHTAGTATCERCRAHFKRPDLLARHMERHKQKDQEAGGIGVLNTRKRSWKQPDGKIVAKRPQSKRVSQEENNIPSLEDSILDANVSDAQGPLSPPASHESEFPPSGLDQEPGFEHLDFQRDDAAPTSATSIDTQPYFAPIDTSSGSDLFWNSSLGPAGPSLYPGSVDVPYDQVFQADTASSFNMPYTTATNYNWLFDLNMNFNLDNEHPVPPHDQLPTNPLAFQPQERMGDSWMPMEATPNPPTPQSLAQRSIAQASHVSQRSGSAASIEQILPGSTASVAAHSTPSSHPTSIEVQSRPKQTPLPQQGAPPIPGLVSPERPLSSLQRPSSFPCIDECTREQLLDLIESLHPVSPDGEPVTRDHRFLSLSSLQTYLDLFFTRFNTAYPLIHKPTFVASNEQTLLLLAVLLLGATYSSKPSHQLAVCIHDVMRPAIFVHAGFSSQPELWVLETILLVECFGKSRAGQKQHDMSHLFHGLLINLIRRSDCQTAQPIGPDEAENTSDDLEIVWLKWAEAEKKKRLALLCFLWDTQHAVLFCQSLCMSSFELRLPLPCPQSLWEAETASEWKQQGATYVKEPHFLAALKSYLTPSAPRPANLSSLSRILILHGLMSIFWDMQRRDQTSLGVIPGGGGAHVDTWRDRMSRAYDVWKADFDAHCSNLAAQMKEPLGAEDVPASVKEAQQEFAVFAASYNAVYHSAQILLNADFLDLQIYAGARHILGRPVQRADYVRSDRIVREWASGDASAGRPHSASRAAWHAAAMLADASQKLDNFDAMGLFHVPWCLYLATLTCWAFHHFGPGQGTAGDMTTEMIWDAKAEMEALISSMSGARTPREVALRQGRERTGGLVWVMASVLERVRWGIVHAGVMVLRGLVPWRMINQYDEI